MHRSGVNGGGVNGSVGVNGSDITEHLVLWGGERYSGVNAHRSGVNGNECEW